MSGDDDPTGETRRRTWRPDRRSLLRRVAAGAGGTWVATGTARATDTPASPDSDRAADAGGNCPAGPPATSPVSVTRTPQGRFFTDAHGRTVIFHGVNAVHKRPPFLPPDDEFDGTDLARIRSWGFNFVRLGVIWEGIAPEAGSIDAAYLDRLRRIVRRCRRYGLYVLVDMHQDLYGREFGGDGAPPWAIHDDGFPYEPIEQGDFSVNYFQPAVSRSFEHFWRNDFGLQDAYAAAWQRVADAVGDERNVVGYDLMNEPARGGPGQSTAAFDNGSLEPFYNRVIPAIRAADGQTPIWVEPEITFDVGKPTTLADVRDDQLAFGFHDYANLVAQATEGTPLDAGPLARSSDAGAPAHEVVFRNAERAGDRLGAPPMLNEFGSRHDPRDIGTIVSLADDHLMGWAYWSYKLYPDWTMPLTAHNTGGLVAEDGSLSPNLAVLVRPYPRRIAGTPLSYGFDAETRRFSLRYAAAPTRAPTVLFVPDRHYPDGHDVSVMGGRVVCDRGQYVAVRNDRDATVVEVVVTS